VLVRVLEVAGEMHKLLGYIPKMVILREKKTKDNYKVEAEILKITEKHKHTLDCTVDMCGESELRKMNEIELLDVYDKCILKDYPADEGFKVEL
jgi:hypothetical protein